MTLIILKPVQMLDQRNLLNLLFAYTGENSMDYTSGLMTENQDSDKIRYWIYEMEMPEECWKELDAACTSCRMTMDEFINTALRNFIYLAENEPEQFEKIFMEITEHPESSSDIRIVRYYPVYADETDEQARDRKIKEENKGDYSNEP